MPRTGTFQESNAWMQEAERELRRLRRRRQAIQELIRSLEEYSLVSQAEGGRASLAGGPGLRPGEAVAATPKKPSLRLLGSNARKVLMA